MDDKRIMKDIKEFVQYLKEKQKQSPYGDTTIEIVVPKKVVRLIIFLIAFFMKQMDKQELWDCDFGTELVTGQDVAEPTLKH